MTEPNEVPPTNEAQDEKPAEATSSPATEPTSTEAPVAATTSDAVAVDDSIATGEASGDAAPSDAASNGPLNLARIRELRESQQKRPSKPAASESKPQDASPAPEEQPKKDGESAKKGNRTRRPKPGKKLETGKLEMPKVAARVEVPSTRQPLPDELENQLEGALIGADLDSMLIGDDMLQVGRMLEEGQRIQAKVVKMDEESIFVSLGGPDEGIIPVLQLPEKPEIGSSLEVIVRGFLQDEGLYEVTVPGSAVEVADWSDINEGEVVEATITKANTGGLECTVGAIRGFIPASQAAEFRIEDLSEMVGQKVLCVITEANQRRGNLVLSRRAVLEREKAEKRAERLAALEVGAAVDGTVTRILDFGAFVDIGGLEGLLHISQLSWERVQHPSEILNEGQKVKVRVDKIDEKTGKIGLSYRSLQEHPWADIESKFAVGTLVKGKVTRIAEFGAFVKIATGVEGLVHLSELAHHRVSRVQNVVSEGDEVEVKILSVDAEKQRMSLSLKAAQAAPEPTAEEKAKAAEEERPPEKPALPKHRGPLKGGTGGSAGGEQFGLKW